MVGIIFLVIFLTIIVMIILLVGFGYWVGKKTYRRLFNNKYCKENPKSLPCSIYNYDECVSTVFRPDSTFDPQTALNLGSLYFSTVETMESKYQSNFVDINQYWLPVKGEKSPIVYLYHYKNDPTVGFIVVRGTDRTNWEEWKIDAKYALRKHPKVTTADVYCCRGFLKSYLDIRDSLLNDINKSKIKTFFVVGNSLGSGIIASMMADLLENAGDRKYYVYCFGSPRGGGLRLATFIENHKNLGSYNNIINLSDIVPNLPEALMYSWKDNQIEPYSHIGYSVVFDRNYDSYKLNHAINVSMDYLANTLLKKNNCGTFVHSY